MPDAAVREKNEWDGRGGWLVRGAPLAAPVLADAGLLILYKLLPVLELAAPAALLALVLRTLMLWMGKLGIRP